MKVFEVLTGNMTYGQASQIFKQLGWHEGENVAVARKRLIMQHHPDRGGDAKVAQLINAAYDVLKKGNPGISSAQPQEPQPDFRDGTDPRGQYYGARRSQYDTQQPPPNDEDRYPIWAQAGHSGGMKETGRIYRQDYTDMNFIKKSMWELSGKSTKEYTIWGFDGRFFRNSLTVYGSARIFNYMAQAMLDWQTKGGNPYECRAVFVSPKNSKVLFLIYADGKFYGDQPIPVEHGSFNMNPSNDQQFMRSLPDWLDQIQ